MTKFANTKVNVRFMEKDKKNIKKISKRVLTKKGKHDIIAKHSARAAPKGARPCRVGNLENDTEMRE